METNQFSQLLPLIFIFIAAMVHGGVGIGFPMLVTPLLTAIGDLRSAILLTLFPTVLINIANILKGGNWHLSIGRFWPMAIYGAVGSLIGSNLILILDPGPFRLLLSAMILLYLWQSEHPAISFDWIRTHTRAAMLLFGLLAGFLAGTVNVMLPVLIIFGLESGLGTTVMIQLFNLCFLAGKLAQIGVFTQAGLIDRPFLSQLPPFLAVAGAGLLIGFWVRDRIADHLFRRILRSLLFFLAIFLVFQVAWDHRREMRSAINPVQTPATEAQSPEQIPPTADPLRSNPRQA